MQEKQCTRCKETKPLDLFYRQTRSKDGRKSQCKSCISELQKIRYSNPEYRERALATAKAWIAANKERVAEYKSKKYRTDPEYREKVKATTKAKYHGDAEYRARAIKSSVERRREKLRTDPEYRAMDNQYQREYRKARRAKLKAEREAQEG